MDAMADTWLTRNESTEDWMRDERVEGGVVAAVGGVEQGNGAAACLATMITN